MDDCEELDVDLEKTYDKINEMIDNEIIEVSGHYKI